MEKDQSLSLPDEIINVTQSLDVDSLNEIRKKLILLINELINKDFHALIQLLYRIDVNEKKIKLYLEKKSGEDAPGVLADLIIERQIQKMETRKKFGSGDRKESEEEKW